MKELKEIYYKYQWEINTVLLGANLGLILIFAWTIFFAIF